MNRQNASRLQQIPWGISESLDFDLPTGWNLLGTFKPSEFAPLADIHATLETILSAPEGCVPLKELARGKKKVAIVVDDISRPTPAYLLLGKILDHLVQGGVDLKSVTIVTAPGLHREMSLADMERKAGKDVLEKVGWENHNCRNSDQLSFLGKTDRGTPVFINKTVAEADLRILVGTIEPHPHAGFGGGFKNILPGVAGVDTIATNHAICASPKYFFMLGSDPANNPMRLDLEQAGSMLKGDTFIVNTVLNAQMQIIGVVAGDPIKAHRQGVTLAAKVFGVRIPAQADVVITDSFPMDIDLRQGAKAVANVLYAARPGGVILAALKCEEGLGNMRVPQLKLSGLPAFIWKPIIWLLGMLITKISPPGTSPEERFSTYFMLKAILRNRILIYSPSVASQAEGLLPGIEIFRDFPDALRSAAQAFPKADVVIFPHGGAIYPEIGK
jgi:nickel-dependent lactate racemase